MGFGKPSALHVIGSKFPKIALSSFGSTIHRGGTKLKFYFDDKKGKKNDENFIRKIFP